ncbi:MAG TPA: hypothetical protein PKJ08_03020 [Candidatus Cloacimonadota bacterium]|nr:hypothetical protein [Candidatus Cloacimonadota bacterium]
MATDILISAADESGNMKEIGYLRGHNDLIVMLLGKRGISTDEDYSTIIVPHNIAQEIRIEIELKINELLISELVLDKRVEEKYRHLFEKQFLLTRALDRGGNIQISVPR